MLYIYMHIHIKWKLRSVTTLTSRTWQDFNNEQIENRSIIATSKFHNNNKENETK